MMFRQRRIGFFIVFVIATLVIMNWVMGSPLADSVGLTGSEERLKISSDNGSVAAIPETTLPHRSMTERLRQASLIGSDYAETAILETTTPHRSMTERLRQASLIGSDYAETAIPETTLPHRSMTERLRQASLIGSDSPEP